MGIEEAIRLDWCERHGLSAAINVGMYAKDDRTYLGYMRCGSYVNASDVNHYESVEAFGLKRDDLPLFHIYDLDDPDADIETIVASYDCVIQNPRLIKRPGENRWSPQDRMCSEAALGEDGSGRALFIFCRTPYTMHEFNDVLISLPIDLRRAQHLCPT